MEQILSHPQQWLLALTAGPETKASGHSGILESAKAVLEDLQSTGVLQRLMQEPAVSPCLLPKFVFPCIHAAIFNPCKIKRNTEKSAS